MLITRETDYALRILRALSDGEKHTARALAEGEQVPQPFAYKILKKLALADYVTIARGAEGGCVLRENLGEKTLYDLICAMEVDASLIACMDPAYACTWRESHGVCTVHCKLAAIQERLDGVLRAQSLAEILADS